MIYRAAISGDLEAIISLHVEISQEAYAKILPLAYLLHDLPTEKSDLWSRRFAALGDPMTQITVMEWQGLIAGFSCFQFDHEPQFGSYLHNLYVAKKHRGGGCARSLIRHATCRFEATRLDRPVHLVVFADNGPARRLYEGLGGKVIEQTERHRKATPPIKVIRYQWQNARRLAEAANT